MPPMRAVSFFAVLAAVLPGQDHPALALERAVDFADAKQRRAAAQQLAARKDVTLAQWLEICKAFGTFVAPGAGPHHDEVELMPLGKAEKTLISWYVPKGYQPQTPAPLLLAMHGTGMDGRNEHLMWAPVAEKLGMLIVAPSESGKNEGYAFTERERQIALLTVRWLRRRCNVDENRIYCSGESRGGHMTWDLALRRPDQFAALVPMIGGPMLNPADGLNNLRYLPSIAHLPIRDLQGSKDDPGLVFNLHVGFEILKHLGAKDAQLLEFEHLGHSFRFDAVKWEEWLPAARREPFPTHLTLAFARPGEARAHWLEVTRYASPVAENFKPKLTEKELEALNRKDEAARKRWWQAQTDQRTGVARARREPGRIVLEGTGIAAARLLLPEAAATEVVFAGKVRKFAPRASATVLLTEFVERFDRSFLPVVELVVP